MATLAGKHRSEDDAGLDRIGDLLPLPRAPLPRRLGLATVERLDQALGRVAEPVVGIVAFEPPATSSTSCAAAD